MSNGRQYYEDIGYKPFLFYVVFGVSGDELEVSRTKHNVDGMPEGLDIISLARPDHSDYIDGLIGGGIGEHLKKADSDLYEACRACDKVVIMRGEIADDSTLDYMRNLIGICEASSTRVRKEYWIFRHSLFIHPRNGQTGSSARTLMPRIMCSSCSPKKMTDTGSTQGAWPNSEGPITA